MAQDQTDLQTVQGIYQSFGRGDIPAILEGMAEDVDWIWHGPAEIPFAGQYLGRAAIGKFFARVGAAAEVERYEAREFLTGHDGLVTVLGWQRVRARSTGRVWETPFAHVWTLRGGKVARVREYYDTVPILRAFQEGI